MAKKIINIITTAAVVIVVILALLLVGVRVIGYTPFAILTGSMTPVYCVGDLVYVKEASFEDIKVGDDITFVIDESLTVATHRVEEVDEENKGFYTKGIANDTRDGETFYENVIGKVSFSIPKLGYISAFLEKPSGKYAAVAVFAMFAFLLLLPDLFKKKNDSSKQ